MFKVGAYLWPTSLYILKMRSSSSSLILTSSKVVLPVVSVIPNIFALLSDKDMLVNETDVKNKLLHI